MSLLSILFGRSANAGRQVLTGATVILSADHRNQETGDVHAHTWKITAWVARQNYKTPNALYLQHWMEDWRKQHSGKCLPDKIAWGENLAADMAEWLGQNVSYEGDASLFDVRAVLVERDEEGLSAAWIA